MGARGLAFVVLAGCGHSGGGTAVDKPAPADMPARVAADFEKAVVTGKDAYVDLFDFSAVGEYEILLHRYDLNGRFPNLSDKLKTQYTGEDGTPYPPTRERRNVGNFYPILAQRTVGTGGCTGGVPISAYGRNLGKEFEPLPAGTPSGYDKLRTDANAWLGKGGVVGIRCKGDGGIAVVYTAADNARGYNLITIYDDVADE